MKNDLLKSYYQEWFGQQGDVKRSFVDDHIQKLVERSNYKLEYHVIKAFENKGFRFETISERNIFFAERVTCVSVEGSDSKTLYVGDLPICSYGPIELSPMIPMNENYGIRMEVEFKFQELVKEVV